MYSLMLISFIFLIFFDSTLDFATAMTYDFHMFIKNVDTVTSFNSALYPIKRENRLYSVVSFCGNVFILIMTDTKFDSI